VDDLPVELGVDTCERLLPGRHMEIIAVSESAVEIK